MDKHDPPKPRRPLPTPMSGPRPNTPVSGNVLGPVAPADFYGAKSSGVSQTPPPLPRRTKQLGSGHTTYLAPPAPPPIYRTNETPFREPELITEEAISNDADVHRGRAGAPGWYDGSDAWSSNVGSTWEDQGSSWQKSWNGPSNDSGWSGGFDSMGYENSQYNIKPVPIDGRAFTEEEEWWNPETRAKANRPGPGMLPPLMAEMLHNSEHTLYSVSATQPDIKPPSLSVDAGHSRESSATSPISSPTSSSGHHRHSSASFTPPTPDNVRTAIPHPNAYFCPKENGWVLLIWKSSSVLPPLAKSFQDYSLHYPFPDQTRRRRTGSCIGEGEQPFGQVNKTHHFHKYEGAVDAKKLNPPFNRGPWERDEAVKQQRRGVSINMDDLDLGKMKAFENLVQDSPDEEGDLLDLYVCCQCSFYCVASRVIPGVIPRKFFEAFVKEKRDHPRPGKTGEAAVMKALELLAKILEDKLWTGERCHLPVMRPSFQTAFGWTPAVQKIFAVLGYTPRGQPAQNDDFQLIPPNLDVSSPEGAANRARWLRAWIEVSSCIQYHRATSKPATLEGHKSRPAWVTIHSAREIYQRAVGAHPDQSECFLV
jgi:ubiquitin carboxyl-terminal hydrolase 25/28